MSNTIRIIPRLDIKGPNLVKGVHLEGLRVLGKPEMFAKYYYEQGADELIYMDVVASLYERNSLKDIITKTASEIFIPLTVGGGLRSIQDITNVLRAGADKVALNTSAIKNNELIKQASEKFGSSTIVVAIETIKQEDGKYLCYTDNGREYTGIEAIEWAQKAEELGAGEILLTSVDREGTGLGYDIGLLNRISTKVNISVVAHGGASNSLNVAEAIVKGGASACAISSILHYDALKNYFKEIQSGSEGNTEFLKSGRDFSKIETCNLPKLKKNLSQQGIKVRM